MKKKAKVKLYKPKKPTPSQIIKGLKTTGWYHFVEWMIAHGYSAYDLEDDTSVLDEFRSAHIQLKLARSLEREMFAKDMEKFTYGDTCVKLVGLSEQVTPKSQNNKMVKNGKYR